MTGYETILPYRLDKRYCIHAKQSGKVIKLNKTSLTVRYKDNTEETFKLKSWFGKEVAGVTYRHQMTTLLEENDTFDKFDNLIYDKVFFDKHPLHSKRIAFKSGSLALVAMTEEEYAFEDSTGISKNFSKELASSITTVRDIVLPIDARILNMKSVGDYVKYLDPLLTFSTMDSEPTDNDMANSILQELNNSSPKAKTTGYVLRIECIYNSDLENASESILGLVKKSDKQTKSEYGVTGKVDNTYSIKGKPLKEDEIQIIFYIEKKLPMSMADKYIVGNQLKTTVGKIYDSITTVDGEEVDIIFSLTSKDARIVFSPDLMGSTNMILKEITNRVLTAYKE